jgi:preprotein translocase subunit SecG
MLTVILVIHLILAIALVAVVLLQKSEGGALGIGGSAGGMGGFLSGRSTANLLTRTTAFLAAGFIITSLALAKLSGGERAPASILDTPPAATETVPAPPTEPTAPLAR